MSIGRRFMVEAEEDPWDAHSSMMKWASAILVTIIFLIALGVSIIWLAVHPRQLKYAVQDAFVPKFELANDSHLSAACFNITMSAFNPNHQVSFLYDSMKVSVKGHGHILASTNVPPLFHGKENLTNFSLNLASYNLSLPLPVWSKLKFDKQSGDIKIDVIIEASVKFKAQHWKQDHCAIRIYCTEVVAHLSRQQAFKETQCDVEL